MKVAIGAKLTDQAYGGGNHVTMCLRGALLEKGHMAFNDLTCSDLDIILLTQSLVTSESTSFGVLDIHRYLEKINPRAIVVHRVQDCDERKGTQTVNKQIGLANSVADYTIYVSDWLMDLFAQENMSTNRTVVRNGADRNIFKFLQKIPPESGEKIRIVTHHWSTHVMKGWDMYKWLDRQLGLGSPYEFHFIGRYPKGIVTRNIVFHSACTGKVLADKLRQNHIYLTASINEPAGMHHIEGASVGLPVVYRKSGSNPEYCSEYGVGFVDQATLWQALETVRTNYPLFVKNMASYPHNGEIMSQQYLGIFERLLANRESIYEERKKKKKLGDSIHRISKYYGYYLLNRLGYR